MSLGDKSKSTLDLIDNGNSNSNKPLDMTVAIFNKEIYLEQKYIYFLYENIFQVSNFVKENNEKTLLVLFSSLNIVLFLIFLFNILKLRLIHITCILLAQVITLVAGRGMGIYFYSQSISGRFIEFLKSLLFPLTSNSPFGYEPRSSAALLISLLIIGSSFEFKNRNALLGLALAFIPIIHYPTALLVIPIVIILWRFKILNLFTLYFYFLIIGLLSIRLSFSNLLIQNSDMKVVINLVITAIIILTYYKMIIAKKIESQEFSKSSIFSCHVITLIYLILSLTVSLLLLFFEKNGYYWDRYWINNSITELPARINSFLTIPVYYIMVSFISIIYNKRLFRK